LIALRYEYAEFEAAGAAMPVLPNSRTDSNPSALACYNEISS
jgi:hypothetical protein